MKSIVTKKMCFLFGFLIIVIGKADVAYAADDIFCARYAKTAVEQYKKGKANNCEGLVYPRWSDDYNHHCQWCIKVSQALAESEQKAREEFLRKCKGLPPIVEKCDQYAKVAVSQNNENIMRGCGFTGPRWSSNYDYHYNWCVHGANRDRADDETWARHYALAYQCPTGTGDLSALSWCYEIHEPLGMGQTVTITFHAVIYNVGERDWYSKKEGKYYVGAAVGSISKQKTHTLRRFPYWSIKAGEAMILGGVTLPFHKDNIYSYFGSWNFLHDDDVNVTNNSLGNIASVKGEQFMPDGYLANMQCQNLDDIIAYTRTYTAKGCNPCDSKQGGVESDELNGIAHSDKYWFWSSNENDEPELARTPRSSFTYVQKYGWLPKLLQKKGYDHFGDLDFYGNLIYVPVTGNSVPIVAVYDENLEFVKYGRFPTSIQTDAAWVAINPIDGYLYSHGKDIHELTVYKRDFSNGGTLKHVQTITLNFKHAPLIGDSWWKDAWNQGGAFSKNGIFYLVVDHGSDDDSLYSGVHAFKLEGSTGTELTLRSGSKKFIHISYDAETLGEREEELEGITIVNHANLGQVHVIMLNNEVFYDDQMYLYHFFVDNGY